jgi:hypothetical protein
MPQIAPSAIRSNRFYSAVNPSRLSREGFFIAKSAWLLISAISEYPNFAVDFLYFPPLLDHHNHG